MLRAFVAAGREVAEFVSNSTALTGQFQSLEDNVGQLLVLFEGSTAVATDAAAAMGSMMANQASGLSF